MFACREFAEPVRKEVEAVTGPVDDMQMDTGELHDVDDEFFSTVACPFTERKCHRVYPFLV